MPKIPCRRKHSNCQAAWLLQFAWSEATRLEYTAIKPIIRIIYIMEPNFKPRWRVRVRLKSVSNKIRDIIELCYEAKN